MSLTFQNHLTISPSRSFSPFTKPQFKNPKISSLKFHKLELKRAFRSNRVYPDDNKLDPVLSIAEVVCLGSSAIITIRSALKYSISRVSVLQYVLVLSAVVIGIVIRRRQWMRFCMNFSKSDGSGVNLVEKIEKLEEDIRDSVTIVRALSRKVEKLGIRFRVSRRSLKDPVEEAIALAQKNSEATGSLAVQGNTLEKEIGEIQKFLLAMQSQQQKQLELICAIGENENLFEAKKEQSPNSIRNEDLTQKN